MVQKNIILEFKANRNACLSKHFPRTRDKETIIRFLEDHGFVDVTGNDSVEMGRPDGIIQDCYRLGKYDNREDTKWIRFRKKDSETIFFIRTEGCGGGDFGIEHVSVSLSVSYSGPRPAYQEIGTMDRLAEIIDEEIKW